MWQRVTSLYAVVDYREPAGVIDWYSRSDEAEAEMREVLRDEPGWTDDIDVLEFELETNAN